MSVNAHLPTATSVWTCPCCPLLCDDLRPTVPGGQVHPVVAPSDCALAHQRLTQWQAGTASPRVQGQPVTLEAAIDAAAHALRASRQPLLAGLGTDVAGARALVPLALATGAITDAAGGAALAQALRAQQDRGGFTATLAELHERADLIVFVGSWAPERAPRLLQRVARQHDTTPTLVSLGATVGDTQGLSVGEVPLEGDLLATLATLTAVVGARQARGPGPGLRGLAEQLARARYAVLVWEPAQLGAHAALAIERLQQLIGLLNRKGRAAGFPLGGGDGAATANQVFTWMTGLPLRSRLTPGALDHDPQTLDTQRLLASHSVDLLCWVSAFGAAPPPPGPLPRVVLAPAHVAAQLGDESRTVYLPVATPGLGHAGHLFRTDGVVLMPLHACTDQGLPSVAELAGRLLAAWQARSPQAAFTGVAA